MIHESTKILKLMLASPVSCLNDEFFWLAHTPVTVERTSTEQSEARLLDFCLVPKSRSSQAQEWMLAAKSHNDQVITVMKLSNEDSSPHAFWMA